MDESLSKEVFIVIAVIIIPLYNHQVILIDLVNSSVSWIHHRLTKAQVARFHLEH